jgi:hypothetical protein
MDKSVLENKLKYTACCNICDNRKKGNIGTAFW